MLHITISAEKVFSIGHFSVTNTLLMTWVVALVLIAISQLLVRKMSLIPSLFQNVIEACIEKLLGFMEKIFDSRQKAEKYFPFIATIFIFILISNWLGIIPGIGSVGFYTMEQGQEIFIPFLRSGASDLNFTLALALIAVIAINMYGILAQGLRVHLSHFITFKNPLDFFVGILELVGEIAKIISFSFRLFGNVFAGEILLLITGFLVPYVVPVPFLGLELFVGFIQALVFATLTLIFISIAVEPTHSNIEEHA